MQAGRAKQRLLLLLLAFVLAVASVAAQTHRGRGPHSAGTHAGAGFAARHAASSGRGGAGTRRAVDPAVPASMREPAAAAAVDAPVNDTADSSARRGGAAGGDAADGSAEDTMQAHWAAAKAALRTAGGADSMNSAG